MSTDDQSDPSGLFPPTPEELAEIMESMPESAGAAEMYEFILESQCGATDDSQPVEQYDGTLGVTTAFVDRHERPVGQLQWNDNLADIYDNPGNVNNVRWCTGTLISEDLFLTAGHCFDQTGGNWQRPRINGTNTIIPVTEIATNIHINFNYQVDAGGNLQTAVQFPIEELLEYRIGGLDYAIVRLGGKPSQTFGMGAVAQSDPAEQSMLCIIGHPAGVPKRIEAGPLTRFQGDRIRYDDIDTLGGNSGSAIWLSPGGRVVGVHTNGGCTTFGTGSNFGVRIGRILDESPILRELFLPPLSWTYTIQQKSSNRFVDAHQRSSHDFSVVTRTAQSNDTQRWIFTRVGGLYTMQQVSNGRFMDAHQNQANDFSVVTRGAQHNDTQRWVVMQDLDGGLCTYTIQQMSSGRFVDAHQSSDRDFSIVTRTAQRNDTQRWILTHLGGNTYTMQQKSSGRYVDAHENSANDFSVVTRNAQNNDTQRWILTPVGGVYTIEQKSSGRFVDAHQNQANDFSVVTRKAQHNDTQRWVLKYLGSETYTIQQLSGGRFVDAHESSAKDFSVVTRGAQNNDTQRWVIKKV